MELTRLDSLLFRALYAVEAGIVVTQIMDMDSLTSLLFLLTFPITVLLWLRSVRRTVATTDLLMGAAAALAVICVFINASFCGGGIGFQYLRKLIMFVMTLLFFQTAHRTCADRKVTDFFNKMVDGLVLFLIVMYFARWSQMHMLGGKVSVYLTFRFTNPNLTALFLGCLFMMKVQRLFEPGKWFVKLYHWITMVILLWFIVMTKSRNCLLATLLFSAVSIWFSFSKRKSFTMRKRWAVTVAVFPAVFVIGYMVLVYSPWIQDLLSFLVSEGKDLNSRVKIWGPALDNIAKSPLIGAYYQISNGTGSSQMHNSHLDIAASYGLPVLVLVCVLFGIYLYQKGRRYDQKSQYLYLLAFCCAILLGIGEAAVFSGGMGIYIFVGSCLMFANGNHAQ